MQWIVGITEPAKEDYVLAGIQRRFDLPTYCPKFEETYIDKKLGVRHRVACLFPRYFFVQTDGHYRFLFDVFGMASVLRHSDCAPVVMSEEGIAQLKASEDSRGLIRLPEKLARRFKPLQRYGKGQKLRVAHGALIGHSGVCLGDRGKARIWVLLRYLGRSTPVQLPRDYLVAA